ncbi:hypothetical protein RCH12_002762 [Cryobacterium sp. MP_3.1]|uniref:hypothetical protein n=1 Tax=Cryobacterium sp. MP_3.1 TaxID=3071711 RepID=UPI002E0A4059|nr:hypothetical protein [Cryobacterium sp. MP_3.1]
MTKREPAPAFWMTGELTGGELRVADSPAGLIASVLEGYGEVPLISTADGEPGGLLETWKEIKLHDRFAFACQVATEYQARALVAAEKAGTWSLAGATEAEVDRLYTTRSRVPDGGPWAPGLVKLIIVHPVAEAIQWDSPVTSRSLVVIDPRTEVNLLRGLEACGALSSAGRLDLRSRYKSPRDQ